MANITNLYLQPSQPFDFHSAITAHGWVALQPNVYNQAEVSFTRAEALPGGQVALLTVSDTADPGGRIQIKVESPRKLRPNDEEIIKSRVRHMLRLDEDYSEFHALCRHKGGAWKGLADGRGRMLRSPALFEDLVKVICTTNIQWGGTQRMVKELVDIYGLPYEAQPAWKSFPTPEAIASDTLENFRQKVNLGYRAAYIHELSAGAADGKIDLAGLADGSAPTAEIRRRLKGIKGIGDYAAASMLMLLDRYDEIPMDTVFRDFMSKKYFEGGALEPRAALEIYADWGKWKSLAYWFEMLESG